MKSLIRRRVLIAAMVAGLGLTQSLGMAEDIDIYATNDTGTATNPNVLIIIDNSANWSRQNQDWPAGVEQGRAELNALRTVVSSLGGNINVGMMMFTPGTTNNNPNGPGGYVRYAVRPMNSANKGAFAALIGNPSGCTDGPNSGTDDTPTGNTTPNCIYKNFDMPTENTPGEKVGTAKSDYSAALFEAYKYFGGHSNPAQVLLNPANPAAGGPYTVSTYGPQRHSGAPDPKSDPWAYTPLDTGAANSTNRNTHLPPISADNSCSKNYIIFIGNSFPTQDTSASLLSGVGGDTAQIPLYNMVLTSVPSQTLLTTTACGTYTDISACQAAAATTYGPAYNSYTCTDNSTCAANSTTTTQLGSTSTCGLYADVAACQAAADSTYGSAYQSYSCTEVSASCPYTQPNTVNPVIADTGCIGNNLNTTANCTSYGNTNASGYAGFTCTSIANCGGGNRRWRIDAVDKKFTGKTFNTFGTKTVTSATTSHKIFGVSTKDTYTPTTTSPLTSAPVPSNTNNADEWARFLHNTDVNAAPGIQNVTMYTVDVYNKQQDKDQTALLMNMAAAGGGDYYAATNAAQIQAAFTDAFAKIQSVNSVFASASLPVNAQNQSTFLNQVFFGMFRPDGDANPRWPGNLKQYRLKDFSGRVELADKDGNRALDPDTNPLTGTGFIDKCANSFWSTDSGAYWNYPGTVAIGGCATETSQFASSSRYSDAPDGATIEKGGAAQRLRGVTGAVGTPSYTVSTNYTSRVLKTCDPNPLSPATPCDVLTNFVTGNASITAGSLGVASGQRDNLINWVRGQDLEDENNNLVVNEMRPSVHGDVVHSQPVVVDYGAGTGVITFYGSNGGVFHAVDGGQTDTEGTELWGFIAPETFNRFARLKTNELKISFPGILDGAPKDYFFDGSIGIFKTIENDANKVWLFPTMRRGGRAIYAFDVSSPANPIIMWRKGCFTNSTGNDTNCSAGWTDIGQTWSKPQQAFINGYVDGNGVPKPVLIFGGGYDTCEDTNSQTRCAGARKGAGIWFIDAATGDIIRIYPTNYSVPGEVTFTKDSAGYVQYVYVGDTGGYVYRVNVGTYDGATFGPAWSSLGAANIDLAYLSEANQARKFMYGPDIVEYATFNAVLIGSGDREQPLKEAYPCGNFSSTAGSFVTNQFYMIKDTPAAYPETLITPSSLTNITNNQSPSEADIGASGWVFNYVGDPAVNTDDKCEQSVNRPLSIAGTVYFGTNQPKATAANSCVPNLGTARGYAVEVLSGTRTSTVFLGGGLPPSPVAGVVDVDGEKKLVCIGCDQPLGPIEPPFNPTGPRKRMYWHMETDKID